MSVSVVIVDDHQLLVDALAQHLAGEADLEVVGRYHTLREALAALDSVWPDVVLLDHRLSDADGGVSARAILDLVPDTAVLLMSASEAATVLADALDAGVSGFVHKSRSADAVLQAVRAVAAGETAFEPADLRLAWRRMRERKQHGDLTERELEVVSLMVEGHRTAEIAERLVVSHHTVRNHIRHVLEKLGAHSQVEAVAAALRLGLVAPPRAGSGDQENDGAS